MKAPDEHELATDKYELVSELEEKTGTTFNQWLNTESSQKILKELGSLTDQKLYFPDKREATYWVHPVVVLFYTYWAESL